ncbi:class I adenylate-forming enzyme family protein [Ferroacidibacillus organovorans]|uniref:O-succinylbenzoate--CoA ligase n=1 Tax=Ferroacidibacillus organovorans TaxID=1765683 RepID=A0A1V4ERE2_9BACL|nr:AMP-binding protein [Ferroacidibacillus organovorans]OPG15506.1 hypothetical protein B2M26_10490 [Ferroacidibacillus organovorans]
MTSQATVHGLLERNARKYLTEEAFVTPTSRLSYSQVNAFANQIAHYLKNSGVGSGERILILSRNNEQFLFSFFGVLKIGAIVAPINTRLTKEELVQVLMNIGAVGILYEASFSTMIHELNHAISTIWMHCIQNILQFQHHLPTSNLDLPIRAEDPCEILFTSGTTGTPKAVLFSHDRLRNLAAAICVEFHITRSDKLLTLMPLTHSAPLNCFFLSGIYAGSSHVIADFSPQLFLQSIQSEHSTITFAAPIGYILAAKELNVQSYDLSSVRVFAYGGGSLASTAYIQIKSAFQSDRFYQVYGLTEAGPNGSFLSPDEHLAKAGSIGKHPTLNMELRVVRDDGTDVSSGERGEIILAGDTLMLGYYHALHGISEVTDHGWLKTGDIAYRDEEGYVFIVDRKKDIIISGGVNIYPREIEEVLSSHPAVTEACVVDVPNDEWGETVKAVVVLNKSVTEQELRTHVASLLADYKCPRIYQFVPELPRNANGKVLKNDLKK